MTVKLSEKALKDLKKVLKSSYGEDFGNDLTDDEFKEIGNLLLTMLTESLKYKIQKCKN